MNIFSRVTWKELWRNPVRTWVTVIGIILSAAMFMAVCTMGVSLWDFLLRDVKMDYGDHFIRYDYIDDARLSSVAQNKRITKLFDSQTLGYFNKYYEDTDWYALGAVCAVEEDYFSQIGIGLTRGRYPQNSSEIVVPEELIYNVDNYGIQLGDTITIDLHTQIPSHPEGLTMPETDTVTQKTYTVVGFNNGTRYRLQRDNLDMESFFTLADGNQGEALWHRAFIQCAPWNARKLVQDWNDPRVFLNDSLLNLYGFTRFDNTNALILSFLAVLCAIIMTGSVSLIYNAFSISVSQRTQQFGLLCSIGATRRQLRRMVFTEGLYLCALGIPTGLGAGYGGIAITLGLLRKQTDAFLSMNGGAVTLRPVFSVAAMVCAGLIALVTVLLSAAIPARRATRVSPMACIRQTQDYQVPKRGIKAGYLTRKVFGLSGVLAKKYYRVSRKKYRATVVSLAISVLLFICAAYFTQNLQQSIYGTVTRESYDMECYRLEDKEALREQSFVSHSAYLYHDIAHAWMPEENYSQEEREFQTMYLESNNYISSHDCRRFPQTDLYYLEDSELRTFLLEQGIDPEPYFGEAPRALVVQKNRVLHFQSDPDSPLERYTFSYSPFAESIDTLHLFPGNMPGELQEFTPEGATQCGYEFREDANGQPQIALLFITQDGGISPGIAFDAALTTDPQGNPLLTYTPEGSDQVAARVEPLLSGLTLGDTVEELPFGIPKSAITRFYPVLILPLSQAPQGGQDHAVLMFNVSDHAAAVTWLDGQGASYADLYAAEETNRTLLLVIQVFSYGFIFLISLIAISNVFNTISTNIQLRRRDFGTLKSVGMTKNGMRKMLVLECLTYGIKALLYGLPPSILLCWLIYKITIQRTSFEAFALPWGAVAIAALSVFCVVFASMFYASHQLNKQKPIEAIRSENI